MVLVVMADGAAEVAPTLPAEKLPVLERVVSRYEEIAERVSVKFGIPHGWILAHIERESGGNSRALRIESNGWIGVGLMQPTSPGVKVGYTNEQLYDPETNITCGARYLALLIGRYGRDFPKVSAAYNAGSVVESEHNPWGMVQTTGHVSEEVAALNSYLLMDQKRAADRALAYQFSTHDLLGEDFDRVTLPDIEVIEEAPETQKNT